MDKKDLKPFLHIKIKLNVKTNNNERLYTGEIIKLNDDYFLFKDKFDLEILFRYDAVQTVEPIPDKEAEK
jgi:hypothetical protein